MTTLRGNIKLKKAKLREDPIIHLSGKIWEIFSSSTNYTKKMLHYVFGVNPPECTDQKGDQ